MAMMTETKLVLFEALEYALINHVGNVESCGWVLAATENLIGIARYHSTNNH